MKKDEVKEQTGIVEDKGNAAWGILGFFLPVVGFILLIVWLCTDKKNDAKYVGIGLLIRFFLNIIMFVLFFSFVVSLIHNPSKLDDFGSKITCMEFGKGYELIIEEDEAYCYNRKTGDRRKVELDDEDYEGYMEYDEEKDEVRDAYDNDDSEYDDTEKLELEEENWLRNLNKKTVKGLSLNGKSHQITVKYEGKVVNKNRDLKYTILFDDKTIFNNSYVLWSDYYTDVIDNDKLNIKTMKGDKDYLLVEFETESEILLLIVNEDGKVLFNSKINKKSEFNSIKGNNFKKYYKDNEFVNFYSFENNKLYLLYPNYKKSSCDSGLDIIKFNFVEKIITVDNNAVTILDGDKFELGEPGGECGPIADGSIVTIK